MKKTAAIIAIIALTAVSAVAYPAYRGQGGPCIGAGAQGGMGQGMGPGMRGQGKFAGQCVQLEQGKTLDDAGAKKLVTDYLSANLKGFKISEIVKVDVPRGSMYSFDVTDSNGNLFIFKVTPFGCLRGPIPAKAIK